MKILIAGGSGLIGRALQNLLKERGIPYAILTRNPKRHLEVSSYKWDISEKNYIDPKAFEKVTHVVNFTGAGIGDEKWTEKRKEEIVKSRVRSTHILGDAIKQYGYDVQAYIGGSAVGYYGETHETADENSSSGHSFLADTAVQWEKAMDLYIPPHLRMVKIRTAAVLTLESGFLKKMATSLSIGIVPYFGNGKQYFPWIHVTDISRMFMEAILRDNWEGVINGVAPECLTSKEFSRHIKNIKGTFLPVMPVPKFVLRLMMGKMSDLVLCSQNIHSKKTKKYHFTFKYPTIEEALSAIYRPNETT